MNFKALNPGEKREQLLAEAGPLISALYSALEQIFIHDEMRSLFDAASVLAGKLGPVFKSHEIGVRAAAVADAQNTSAQILQACAETERKRGESLRAIILEIAAKTITEGARFDSRFPPNLVHVRRRGDRFDLLVNLMALGYWTEEDLLSMRTYIEWLFSRPASEWSEIVFPRLKHYENENEPYTKGNQ